MHVSVFFQVNFFLVRTVEQQANEHLLSTCYMPGTLLGVSMRIFSFHLHKMTPHSISGASTLQVR